MDELFGILRWPATGGLLAGIGTLVLVGYLDRHRGKPGAGWFMIALGTQALFCLSYGVGLLVFDPTLRWTLEAICLIALGWIGPLFLAFSLDYTGRRNLIRGWLYLPFVGISTLATVLLVATGREGLVVSGYELATVAGLSVAAYTIEPLGYVAFVSGLVAAGIGVLLLVETVLSYGPLYRREATAVALSTIAPTVGILLWLFDVGPVPALNLTAALFVPHVLFDAYAFVGTNMFESNPTTSRAAERNAIDDLPNPVTVLDTDGRVVDLNREAKTLVSTDSESVLGRSAESVFGIDRSMRELSDEENAEITLRQDGTPRLFHISAAPLHDPAERTVGSILIFQDITRVERREQRLDVLNRVLRHNLRNGMVAITGHARYIADRTGDETTESAAETIATSGDRLVTVANKARAFEEIRESAPAFTAVDLDELLSELVDRFAEEFPDATIDHTMASDMTVRTDPRLLRLLVSNLLENALEHGGDEQRVSVRAAPADDGIAIELEDDGDGIPEGELTPLRDGEETPLKHGSGIGLWIVHWSAELLGCRLDFDTESGTTVTVTVPETEG